MYWDVEWILQNIYLPVSHDSWSQSWPWQIPYHFPGLCFWFQVSGEAVLLYLNI